MNEAIKIFKKQKVIEQVINCHHLKMKTSDTRMKLINVADSQQLLRLIKSVSLHLELSMK